MAPVSTLTPYEAIVVAANHRAHNAVDANFISWLGVGSRIAHDHIFGSLRSSTTACCGLIENRRFGNAWKRLLDDNLGLLDRRAWSGCRPLPVAA
jgi:hypothetical protein